MSRSVSRETHVIKADYLVECQGCDWMLQSHNGQGTAARHHDKTGHTVRVEITRVIYYGPIR